MKPLNGNHKQKSQGQNKVWMLCKQLKGYETVTNLSLLTNLYTIFYPKISTKFFY